MMDVLQIDNGNSYERDSEWGIWYIYNSERFTSDLSFVQEHHPPMHEEPYSLSRP